MNLAPYKTEVYVFSEGKESDFPEFDKYGNIKYILNGSPQEAFINLCYADLLITASSSFSREAGDINKKDIHVTVNGFWSMKTAVFMTDAKRHWKTILRA